MQTLNIKRFHFLFSYLKSTAHLEQKKDSFFSAIVAERETEFAKMLELLPSGSGFDSGTTFEADLSSEYKLVFKTGFHHMNENGYYDGWTHHKIIVVPSFGSRGWGLKVDGRNYKETKDYIADTFYNIFD